MSERATQLAEAHWNGYVKGLLESHGVSQEMVDAAAYNYITAFCHGYKHAQEDAQTPEPSKSAELIRRCGATDTPCYTCLDDNQCDGGLRMANGQCLHHRRA